MFWFLTREADTDRLRTTAISNDDLLDLIESIPGRKVVFIDASNAGTLIRAGDRASATASVPDMNKLVSDFSTAGSDIVVYSASTGTELSYEDAKWDRHGAFAKALIEAIGEGKAAIDPSGRITTDMLDLYLEDRVRALTDGQQHPLMARPILVPDYPLALARVAPVAAHASVGWSDTIDLLVQERSQAEACAELLKSSGDKAAIAAGRIAYGEAKAESDGAIAGLETALVQGGKPDMLPTVLTNLKKAGAGLKVVCDAAIKAAPAAGTK